MKGSPGRMELIVQIYAFTDQEEARQAALWGVDHIGFVAGEYGLVHGELSFADARRLVDALPEGTVSVALTMATEVEEILRMAEAVRPQVVHISTDPYDVGPQKMAVLHRRLQGKARLMKAIPVQGQESIKMAMRFAPFCDMLLLDSKRPGFPGVGATGLTHDWSLSRCIVQSVEIPVILAGGLTPENVGEAIRTVRPWGVDSNTATNIDGDPVAKDMELVRAFLQAARQAWQREGDRGGGRSGG